MNDASFGATLLLSDAAPNVAALALFGWAGHVWWQFMIPMAVANVVGSHFGARLALSRGSGFIRLVFIAVVAALILKSVTTG